MTRQIRGKGRRISFVQIDITVSKIIVSLTAIITFIGLGRLARPLERYTARKILYLRPLIVNSIKRT